MKRMRQKVHGKRLIPWLVQNLPVFRGKYFLLEKLYDLLNRDWPQHLEWYSPQGIFYELDLTVHGHRTLYFLGFYEADVTWVAGNLLRAGDVVVEGGIGDGLHTLLFSQKVGPEGRVLAFDPLPDACQKVERLLSLNCSSNVQLFQLALGQVEGVGKIHSFEDLPHGHASLAPLTENCVSWNCEIRTLDRVLAEMPVGPIRFIKLDIEGSELAALEGANDTLRRWHPLIAVEANLETARAFDYHPSEILAFLSNFEYLCFVFRRRKWIRLQSATELERSDNLLFVWKADKESLSSVTRLS